MTRKVFPLELTKSTEELKKLIAEHPDYPIVVLAGECANSGDFAWMYCASISFGIEEILDIILLARPHNDERSWTNE